MTRDEADSAQDWASLGGGEALVLIHRYADDWNDAHEMMEAWKRAHVKAEREQCAQLCESEDQEYEIGRYCAEAIRLRGGS